MVQAIPHLLGFVMPLLILGGVRLGGVWTFVPVVFLYGFLPVVDTLAGLNTRNPLEGELPALDRNPWFRLVTWLWVPVQFVLLVWGLDTVLDVNTTWVERAGITVSVGLTTGAVGITFAHELIHRPGRFELALGELLLASVSYTHFRIEHVAGHHRFVATPRDPATARFREPFYRFYPRTVLGGLRSAWRLEVERLTRRGSGRWDAGNRMLRYGLTQAVLYGALVVAGGGRAAIYWAAQAVVAFTLLEVINYVEHYGLERRETAPGTFERVMPWHSWNSSHRVSNWLLINLARHSDHHCLASKRYQALEHLGAAPQLPAGYGTMFLVALFPPLWRRIMDPRVVAWRERDLTP